ncbi:MAG: hypothetical protein FWD69_10170 [Polyangiaceae bacterium]|nr:hypothetical protein [Polyangiaceae bacterium]
MILDEVFFHDRVPPPDQPTRQLESRMTRAQGYDIELDLASGIIQIKKGTDCRLTHISNIAWMTPGKAAKK